jgi:hypothetical protein
MSEHYDPVGELMVTIKVNEAGDTITLPMEQVLGIRECLELTRADGRDAIWHPAACGCCFIVHAVPPEGQAEHEGYVVGQDGGYHLETHDHEGS